MHRFGMLIAVCAAATIIAVTPRAVHAQAEIGTCTSCAWQGWLPALRAQAGPARAQAVLVRTIGGEYRDSVKRGYFFESRIGGVFVADGGGSVYVELPRDNMVRQFDSSGAVVREFGGRGSGPGETTNLLASGLIGDSVWTLNWVPTRVSVFDTFGRLGGTYLLPDLRRDGKLWRAIGLMSRGTALYWPQPVTTASMGETDWAVMASLTGRPLRNLAVVPSRPPGSFRLRDSAGGPVAVITSSGLQRALRSAPFVVPMPAGRGVVVFDQAQCTTKSRFDVLTIDTAGDTTMHGSVDCRRVALPAGVVDSLVHLAATDASERFKLARRSVELQMRAQIAAAQYYPELADAHVANDATLWIRRFARAEGQPEVWERVGQGEGTATFALPRGVALARMIDRSRLWAIARDDDGVESLQLYRVVER